MVTMQEPTGMSHDHSNDAGSAATPHSQAIAAHDIRNELQTILAISDLVEEAGMDTLSATRIGQAAERALTLVNGMLSATRAAHDSSKGARTVFRIGARVAEIADRMTPLAAANGDEISLEVSPPDRAVTGRIELIDTIVQNLLSNAIKFTSNGTIRINLQEDAAPVGQNNTVKLSVEDTGQGMSQDALARLFRPYGSGRTDIAEPEGFGIGTYAIGKAVKALGGTIEVESKVGEGSRFTVTFSLPVAENGEAQDSPHPRHGEDISTENARVLVVDDNPVNLDLFVKSLSGRVALVTPAQSGAAALEAVRNADIAYDLVLADLNMPETDGFALAIELVRSGIVAPCRIAALTADTDEDCWLACEAIGMTSIIQKPVRPEQLRKRVRDIIGACANQSVTGPREPLNARVADDLREEFGPEAARSMMRRALEEAEVLHSKLSQGSDQSPDRSLIHSAIGSSGMTGLARVDDALRVVQAISKIRGTGSAAFSAALAFLKEEIDQTKEGLR